MTWPTTLVALVAGILRSRAALQIENLALRHHVGPENSNARPS
jgi:hypothetical protein